MEAHTRTHLVNELMDEAQLRMATLEKAMEGERIAQASPVRPGMHHPQGSSSLEDEHKAWGRVLKALSTIQTDLEQIVQAEQVRIESVRPLA
ncbi:MAG: hypothetical protein AB7N91_19575 [Candidatus Tectimicrobiota bacterium]